MQYPESSSHAGQVAGLESMPAAKNRLLDVFYEVMFAVVWLFSLVLLVLEIT